MYAVPPHPGHIMVTLSETLLGFLLGTVAGFRSLWRASQQAQRDAEQNRD